MSRTVICDEVAEAVAGIPDGATVLVGGFGMAGMPTMLIGAKSVFVMMNLFAKDGAAKLVPACTYPLTGLRCVRRVYTDHAILDIDPAAGTVRVREPFGIAITELASRMAIELH